MHLRLYHNTSCLLCLLILVTRKRNSFNFSAKTVNPFRYFLFAVNSVAVSASITEYILNGNNAPVTPHHTHIRIRPLAQTPNGDAYVGSGSLISSMHVLTCAQNIYGYEFTVIRSPSQPILVTFAVAYQQFSFIRSGPRQLESLCAEIFRMPWRKSPSRLRSSDLE